MKVSGKVLPGIKNLDFAKIQSELWENGFALTSPVLSKAECNSLIELFSDEAIYRKVVDMKRHGFGSGIYKYFDYPLPNLVGELRHNLYPHLVDVANGWNEVLQNSERFALTLDEFSKHCHSAGQKRPTPLLLKYEPGDFNCLHQDIYGKVAFPLQAAIFLSEPEEDYTGGEFVLVEQIPRAQSRAHVLRPRLGQMIVFTNQVHPIKGKRGYFRAKIRHGVSTLTSGNRYTLGIIFHDAE
jgi:uncharacterized protein